MEKIFQIIAVFLLLILGIVLFLRAQEKDTSRYRFIKRLALPGLPGDYVFAEFVSRHLFVTTAADILVYYMNEDAPAGTIHHNGPAYDITFAPGLQKGFVLGSNTINVFNIFTLQVIDVFSITARQPFRMVYDVFTNSLLVLDATAIMSMIDAASGKLSAQVALGGLPAAIMADENGRAFITLPQDNSIVAIDIPGGRSIHQWSVSPGINPGAMAMDVKNHLLLIGCDRELVIADYQQQTVIATQAVHCPVNKIIFDAATRMIYCFSNEGVIVIVLQLNRQEYAIQQTLHIKTACCDMTLDPGSKKIYLPAGRRQTRQTPVQSHAELLLYWNQ